MQTKKILITGSNGFIGQKLLDEATKRLDLTTIATSRNKPIIPIKSPLKFEILDLTNPTQLEYIVSLYKPEIIINTAALSHADQCEENKEKCWEINVDAVKHLTASCNKHKIHLIHFSSDFIFDGINGTYNEESSPSPISHYGYSKAKSEEYVIESSESYCIIRTSLVYGWINSPYRSNIFKWVYKNLKCHNPINVVSDQYRTPTLVDDLANACLKIAVKKSTGIYNIAGGEKMSIYEFANKIAEAMDAKKNLINPCSTTSLCEKAKRPVNTYLPIEKIKHEIDYIPTPISEGIRKTLIMEEQTHGTNN